MHPGIRSIHQRRGGCGNHGGAPGEDSGHQRQQPHRADRAGGDQISGSQDGHLKPGGLQGDGDWGDGLDWLDLRPAPGKGSPGNMPRFPRAGEAGRAAEEHPGFNPRRKRHHPDQLQMTVE